MLSPSNVLGRLAGKRHVDEIIARDSQTASPLWEEPPRKASTAHSRNSSLLSLASSLVESGDGVRRSISLQSNRTPSRPVASRFSSENNVNWPLSPESPDQLHPKSASPPTPRARARLSFSARSLSQRFKSTDKLPIFTSSEQLDGSTSIPPIPSTSFSPPLGSGSTTMLATSIPRRTPPDRPSLPTNQSSFSRDPPTQFGPLPNGGQLQLSSTISAPSTVASAAGTYSPSAIYQMIHETGTKRIATFDYMRKIHEGDVYYFGALQHNTASLSTLPSLHQVKLGRRATNYMVLGYSLPTQMELNSGSALEYLKALSALLQEFETYQTLVGFDSSGSSLSRGRVGQMFKSGMGLGNRSGRGRRSSATTDNLTLEMSKMNMLGHQGDSSGLRDSHVNPSGHEFELLLTPHLPFDPDFNTTFATLCDTLVDTYARLLDLVSTTEVCTPAVSDAFSKADKLVRKILISNIVREFEDSTRAGVKSEVAGLGRLVLGGLC
ncbi:Hypothetical protein R9X50_00116700 [Acrodontium crateriforme]|uniref:Uncharacterized protein n=1 Tax=Acrodontium crateriforme TaxID=150365 RepID=A0AAQ3R9U2_9PEZI|nr:Hypothetical protein R9X50_00116700 [Acrodontium crateriforme]